MRIAYPASQGNSMNETTNLTDHSVAVFANHDAAEAAIESLSSSGFDIKNLSIIGQNYQSEEHPVDL